MSIMEIRTPTELPPSIRVRLAGPRDCEALCALLDDAAHASEQVMTWLETPGTTLLVEYADDIPFNAQLATIVTDLEIGQDWQDLKINTDPCAHIDELRALYTELEFRNELASLDHPNHPANGNGAQSVADSQADAESQVQIAKSLQSSSIDNIKDSKSHDKAWHTILDEPAFDSLVKLLESAPNFVIDTETTSVYWRQAELVGLSFAVKAHEAYYVPLTHSLEGDELITKQLDRDTVLTRLKPILENPKIGKE